MQTLKTAAIVVLLMTVMYGAYVSLTTPPEPLPADVQSMLDFSEEDSLVIDSGLPESLEQLEINAPSAGPDAAPADIPAGSPSVGVAAAPSPGEFAMAGQDDLTAEIDDASGVSTSLSDTEIASVDIGGNLAPQAGPSATAPNYPNTGATFELPDPNSVAATFEAANAAQPAVPPSDFALASGTSASPASDAPPPSAEIQTAELAGDSLTPNLGLSNAIQTADNQYMDDKRREALATLSIFYNAPNLSGEQRSELLSRLDPLAREVIYSKRHLLEQPHRVGQNETLMDVAAKYEVPWQLLANINQIKDPVTILPGTELKVVRGPFRAEVNLRLKELTLFLGDLYAGRFPIDVGTDPMPKPGTYTIQDKQTAKTYYNRAGSPVPPGSPDNPYGNAWLDLGGQLCIHGSPSTTSPTNQGCISLAADYADDLYGILSQGSSVTIRR